MRNPVVQNIDLKKFLRQPGTLMLFSTKPTLDRYSSLDEWRGTFGGYWGLDELPEMENLLTAAKAKYKIPKRLLRKILPLTSKGEFRFYVRENEEGKLEPWVAVNIPTVPKWLLRLFRARDENENTFESIIHLDDCTTRRRRFFLSFLYQTRWSRTQDGKSLMAQFVGFDRLYGSTTSVLSPIGKDKLEYFLTWPGIFEGREAMPLRFVFKRIDGFTKPETTEVETIT